jgi:hypothetical protein
MDPRVERAQQLFWEVEALRKNGVCPAALPQLLEMARLHEERARELLQVGDVDGWTDLFAAITAWGEARQRGETERLLAVGRGFAAALGSGKAKVEEELCQLEAWLDLLPFAPPIRPAEGTAALTHEPTGR